MHEVPGQGAIPMLVRNDANPKRYFGAQYAVASAGEIAEFRSEVSHANKPYERDRRKGEGHPVRGFSQKSRNRLAKACAAVPWDAVPFVFVTLTYPRQFPADGRRVKRDLDWFRQRRTKRWGQPIGVWKQEFQRRGAPHFHLALVNPLPPGTPLVVLGDWVARTWFEIAGGGDRQHLVRHRLKGTEVLRQPPVAYFSSHGQHGRDKKGYQNTIPEGFRSMGRFWGFWNLRADWDEHRLSPQAAVEARRIMRAWARSRGLRLRPAPGRVHSCWFRTRGRPAYFLVADVLRAVEIATT